MTKKKVIISLASLFIVGISIAFLIAYKMYNKPHRNISDEPSAYSFTEAELTAMVAENLPAAEEKLKDQVIQISGLVKSIQKTGNINNLTFDNGGDYIISIALDSTETKPINTGSNATVKGLYIGTIDTDVDFGIPGEIKIKNGFLQ